MVVLALDTVTRPGSVALWDDGVCHAVRRRRDAHARRAPARRGRRRSSPRTAARSRTSSRSRSSSGPGSFTGLRVGHGGDPGPRDGDRTPRRARSRRSTRIVAGWRDAGRPPLVRSSSPVRTGSAATCSSARRRHLGTAGAVGLAAASIPLGASTGQAAAALVADARRRQPRPRSSAIGDGAIGTRRSSTRTSRTCRVIGPRAARRRRRRAWPRAPDARGGAPHALRPLYLRRPDAELARERRRVAGPRPSRCALDASASRRSACAARRSRTISATVERLQQQTFTNPWGAEAIRWELRAHRRRAALRDARDRAGALVAYCACWMVLRRAAHQQPGGRRRRGGGAGSRGDCCGTCFATRSPAGAAAATLEVRQSNDAARGSVRGLGFRVEGRPPRLLPGPARGRADPLESAAWPSTLLVGSRTPCGSVRAHRIGPVVPSGGTRPRRQGGEHGRRSAPVRSTT